MRNDFFEVRGLLKSEGAFIMNLADKGTQKLPIIKDSAAPDAGNVILQVHDALRDKGYNPTNQIVGYIISGDPTYITGHKGARTLISKLERDALLEELVTFYLENKAWEK